MKWRIERIEKKLNVTQVFHLSGFCLKRPLSDGVDIQSDRIQQQRNSAGCDGHFITCCLVLTAISKFLFLPFVAAWLIHQDDWPSSLPSIVNFADFFFCFSIRLEVIYSVWLDKNFIGFFKRFFIGFLKARFDRVWTQNHQLCRFFLPIWLKLES